MIHTNTIKFPFPFEGISDSIWYPNRKDFQEAVEFLSGKCGHAHHNYAVQGDGQIIYTTATGINCLNDR